MRRDNSKWNTPVSCFVSFLGIPHFRLFPPNQVDNLSSIEESAKASFELDTSTLLSCLFDGNSWALGMYVGKGLNLKQEARWHFLGHEHARNESQQKLHLVRIWLGRRSARFTVQQKANHFSFFPPIPLAFVAKVVCGLVAWSHSMSHTLKWVPKFVALFLMIVLDGVSAFSLGCNQRKTRLVMALDSLWF